MKQEKSEAHLRSLVSPGLGCSRRVASVFSSRARLEARLEGGSWERRCLVRRQTGRLSFRLLHVKIIDMWTLVVCSKVPGQQYCTRILGSVSVQHLAQRC